MIESSGPALDGSAEPDHRRGQQQRHQEHPAALERKQQRQSDGPRPPQSGDLTEVGAGIGFIGKPGRIGHEPG